MCRCCFPAKCSQHWDIERPIRRAVDVCHDVQFASLASNVADLELPRHSLNSFPIANCSYRSKALGSFDSPRTRQRCCCHNSGRSPRSKLVQVVTSGKMDAPPPWTVCQLYPDRELIRYGVWTDRIVLKTVGCVCRWTKIQERIDVDLIVEHAEAPAYDQVILCLIGKSQARAKLFLSGGKIESMPAP